MTKGIKNRKQSELNLFAMTLRKQKKKLAHHQGEKRAGIQVRLPIHEQFCKYDLFTVMECNA